MLRILVKDIDGTCEPYITKARSRKDVERFKMQYLPSIIAQRFSTVAKERLILEVSKILVCKNIRDGVDLNGGHV